MTLIPFVKGDLAHLRALLPGSDVRLTTKGRRRCYATPDGFLPGVTQVLKVLGLGTEGLIAWSGRIEREACLLAMGQQFADMDWGTEVGPAEFVALVEQRLGSARQHQKEIQAAGEIGTSIHQAVQRRLMIEMGREVGPPGLLSDQAEWAYMAWEDWWKDSGYRVIAVEQAVYAKDLGAAGTVDALVLDPQNRVGLIDLKSSKAVYDSHHLQVAAYGHMVRSFGVPLEFSEIVRLPKNTDDPRFEVVPLGKLYDRELQEEDLLNAFRAASIAYHILLAKDGI